MARGKKEGFGLGLVGGRLVDELGFPVVGHVVDGVSIAERELCAVARVQALPLKVSVPTDTVSLVIAGIVMSVVRVAEPLGLFVGESVAFDDASGDGNPLLGVHFFCAQILCG